MKFNFTIVLVFIAIILCSGQKLDDFQYEPSISHPYGKLNPTAPAQVGDFDPLIGLCDCRSLARNGDGSWQDTTDMLWKFKYIMNGTAVQDEVWRENNYAGSIRQYQADSTKWVVTYFSYPSVPTAPGVWLGEREGDKITLFKPQNAPNGMEGFYRIQFLDMSYEGFNWIGEWITKDETVVYPTWKIWCKKRNT